MTPKQQDMALSEALTRCLTEQEPQERHVQWKALTEAYPQESLIDALAEQYTRQQAALLHKQALAEERQTLLNTLLRQEQPGDSDSKDDPMAQMQENITFLTEQVKGYEAQFVRLQQQVRDKQELLQAVTADRDEAVAMKAELVERLSQASLRSAQLATEADRLEKLFLVRLYHKLHRKK